MDTRFKRRERVIYQQNPLVEVICQVRFPRMLELDERLPVEFQHKIRAHYPLLKARDEITIRIASLATEPEKAVPPATSVRVFDFSTEKNDWVCSLGSEFISLKANKYERWELFSERMRFLLSAALEIYRPALFTRIGLRYKDLIARSDLGLKDESWSALFTRPVLGLIGTTEIPEKDVIGGESFTIFKLPQGKAAIRYGPVRNVSTQETAYSIDSDYFHDEHIKADIDHAFRILDSFNQEAGGFFRWCITDRLHNALRPTSP